VYYAVINNSNCRMQQGGELTYIIVEIFVYKEKKNGCKEYLKPILFFFYHKYRYLTVSNSNMAKIKVLHYLIFTSTEVFYSH